MRSAVVHRAVLGTGYWVTGGSDPHGRRVRAAHGATAQRREARRTGPRSCSIRAFEHRVAGLPLTGGEKWEGGLCLRQRTGPSPEEGHTKTRTALARPPVRSFAAPHHHYLFIKLAQLAQGRHQRAPSKMASAIAGARCVSDPRTRPLLGEGASDDPERGVSLAEQVPG